MTGHFPVVGNEALLTFLKVAAGSVSVIASLYKWVWKPCYRAVKSGTVIVENLSAFAKEMKPNGGSSMRDAINRIEKSLARSEERQKILVDLVPFGVFQADVEGHMISMNKTFSLWTGRPVDELKGQGWLNMVSPVERSRVYTEWLEAVHQERVFEIDCNYVDGDGHVFPVSCRADPMKYLADETLGYLGVVSRLDRSDAFSSVLGPVN